MKNSKEILSDIIEFLKKETGKTQGELSVGAGYAAETLAQLKSKESGQEPAIDQLRIVYKEIFKNSIYQVDDIENSIVSESNQMWKSNKLENDIEKDLLRKRIKDLEKIVSLQEEIIDSKKNVSSENRKSAG